MKYYIRTNCFISILLLSASFFLKAEDITTTDGKKFTNAQISKTDPFGIHILHSTGSTFIDFKRLPEEMQKKYGYDPLKAEELRKKVAEKNKQREMELQKQKEQKEKELQEAMAKANEKKRLQDEKNKELIDKIKENPTAYVTIKPMTCLKEVYGGFVYLPVYAVIPVFDKYIYVDEIACRSSAFDNSTENAQDFIGNLSKKISDEKALMDSIPKEIAEKQREIQTINQSIAEIMQASVTYQPVEKTGKATKQKVELSAESSKAIKEMESRRKDLEKEIKSLKENQGKLKLSYEKNNTTLNDVQKKLSDFEKEYKKTPNNIDKTETSPSNEKVEKLKTIKKMLDEGLISQDEYDKKKKEILSSI